MDPLQAISVIDGRYLGYTSALSDIFSEYSLIRHRVYVEVQWLKFLLGELRLEAVTPADIEKIESIAKTFDPAAARRVKQIEAATNHDVKAVEYYIKEEMVRMGLSGLKEWVHFACTSEDINNTSYALMIRAGKNLIRAEIAGLLDCIESMGDRYKDVAMISRTHGQPATPTTVGKEMINFAWRLRLETGHLDAHAVQAKMNGASGNYNAHAFAFPGIDWIEASRTFIADSLGLSPGLYTTQINAYHYISQLLHILIRIASTIIDLDRDMWGYISVGYFRQRPVAGEVGSSTMPHKVNPIDFENSEGNMGVAISLMGHLAVKLLNSRFQRDLTDSTVLRNMGAVFGYLMIGCKSSFKGLSKIDIDPGMLKRDIEANPELLAEAIQTVMRVYKEDDPYEKLKELTRGHRVTRADIEKFLDSLQKVPPEAKARIKALTVGEYTGLAAPLVELYCKNIGR